MLIITIHITSIKATIKPVVTPKTRYIQKFRNIIIPKHNPVIGPANFEQNFTTSIELLEPRADLVVILPFVETAILMYISHC